MGRNKMMKLIAVGSMMGFTYAVPYQIHHTSAEEISISESTALLNTMKIDEFQLNQPFTSEGLTYTANVENSIKSMTLTLETKEESASVTINGQPIASDMKTNFSLTTGENIFTITVTNGTEINTYTLTVIREKNENNQLSNLLLSDGDIDFDPAITSYQLNVDSKISKLTIQPEAEAETSTVQINGTNVAEKGQTVELPVGKSTIEIVVTAENGSKNTYTLTITRANETESAQKPDLQDKQEENAPTSKIPQGNQAKQLNQSNSGAAPSMAGISGEMTTSSTKANLAALTVSVGSWNKSFTSDAYTYHIDLENDVSDVTISANSEESDAEIAIDNHDPSNSVTVAIENKAKTVISVVVTHENDRKTYVLVFDKDIAE